MQALDLSEIQKQIDQQQVGFAQQSPESGRRGASRELITMVWSLMGPMYGHKWTSSYGEDVDPDRVWSAALYGLDETAIRRGMKACVDQRLEWPPSAPQFRELCSPSNTWEHKRIEAADRERQASRLLTHSQTVEERKATARQHLDALRGIVGLPSNAA